MKADNTVDKVKEFRDLIDRQRPREAFALFLDVVERKDWLEVRDLAMLDVLCKSTLFELQRQHTLWMVNNPGLLRRMLKVLTEALAANYLRPTTTDHIAWLRCLLAISEAMNRRLDNVHEELCLAHGHEESSSVPRPNGILREKIKSMEDSDASNTAFLRQFFDAYMGFLGRVGRFEFANFIEGRLSKLLALVARDEQRPGVVQALLYDQDQGYSRFVHVTAKYCAATDQDSTSGPNIMYSGRPQDKIDTLMQEASLHAHIAADAYLKRIGYPDGLTDRLVRWELTTLRGDISAPAQRYEGGSIALPLSVAIVSEYLERPVPNDIALTGAMNGTTAADGHILPVDGIREKLKHAVATGSRVIYLPQANTTQLNDPPSLEKLAAENNARFKPIEQLDQVCGQLLPPEGSGRLKDILTDTLTGYVRMFKCALRRKRPSEVADLSERHFSHALLCSVLTTVLVLVECLMVCIPFAPDVMSISLWSRVIVMVVLFFAAISFGFALPGSFLRHRKRWALLLSALLLALCSAAGAGLLLRVIPDNSQASRTINILPSALLIKDMLVIWLFGWALAGNIFYVAAALEDLLDRRQFVTARKCMSWNSWLEGRMPLICVYFSWEWGIVLLGTVGLALVAWEMVVFTYVFKTGADNSTWLIVLGTLRQCLLIGAIAEVMVFYKMALAGIRKALA